jgi:DNA-binding NarL/FixJ family response regulator
VIGEDDVLLRKGIAQTLLISQAAVEKFVAAIVRKLDIDPANTGYRREQALLMFPREQRGGP